MIEAPLLTVDQSVECTGWIVWSPGTPPVFGSKPFLSKGKDIGVTMASLWAWLTSMHAEHGFRTMAMEEPIKPHYPNIITLRKLYGMAAVIELFCHIHNIACTEINISKWRRHFLGTSAGGTKKLKAMAIEECRTRGFDVANDNEAEAIGITDYLAHRLHWQTDWPDRGLLGNNVQAAE